MVSLWLLVIFVVVLLLAARLAARRIASARRVRLLRERRGGRRPVVAVIGAGVAGLSAGVQAAANGFEVHVFEQHARAGGQCVGWRRGQFVVDGCMCFVPGGESLPVLLESGAVRSASDICTRPEFGQFLDERTGRRVVVGADLDRLQRDLSGPDGADAAPAREFVDGCRVTAADDVGLSLTPPERSSLWSLLKFLVLHPRFALLAARSMVPASALASRFTDPLGRFVVEGVFGIDGLLLFDMFVVGGHSAGREFVLSRGKSQRFADNVADRLRQLGGQLHLSCDVARVQTDAAGRVTGVQLADGTCHQADYVIAAGDLRSLMDKQLEGKYPDPAVENLFKDCKLFDPICYVSFGLRVDLPQSVPESLSIRLSEPLPRVTSRSHDAVCLKVTRHSDDPTLVLEGKSMVQVMLFEDWDWWASLPADQYQAKKAELARVLAERVLKHAGATPDDIEMTDVATPLTWARYTRVHRGAFEGFLPPCSSKVFSEPPVRTVRGVQGMYLAGQWIVPGGGISMSMLTGRYAVMRICEDEGIEYAAPKYEPLHQ